MLTDTPVVLIVFNRPKQTSETFARIREQKPKRLFIVADGPRDEVATDAQRCEEVRSIVRDVDWECDVQCDFADRNLGLRLRVSSGLRWVFSQADRAMVLEDDCLAHADFFRYCNALLERYAEDHRVGVITGDNFQAGQRRGHASYYFSRYPHVWGWATWRRAWAHYDDDLKWWPAWKKSPQWRGLISDSVERRYWERIFDRCYRGEIDSWAYPWTLCVWFRGLLTATPNANLVENIGFGEDATHTRTTGSHVSVPAVGLGPLSHPAEVVRCQEADAFVFDTHFGGRDIRSRRKPAVLVDRAFRRATQRFRR